jgi:bleomycin hydrolase
MLGTGFHAHKTDVMTLLKNRLLLFANELRKADEADFDSLKSGLMTDVKSVLEEQFGAPPEIFNWNYKDKSGEEHHLEGVSPIEFYREFCGGENEYTVFSDERLPLKIDSVPLPIDDIKHLCARQLENDEQVVICADTSQQANQMLGILDTEFNDNTSVYGVDRYMSKADSFNFKRISPRDFLSLDGVEKEDSVPIRFKAQDSNGALTGADGHYTMNANWFDEYVFYAVINNKLLSE